MRKLSLVLLSVFMFIIASSFVSATIYSNQYAEAFTFNNASGSSLNLLGINNTLLTAVNTPTLTAGIIGNATNFVRASSQYLNTSTGGRLPYLPVVNESITLSAWVKPASLPAAGSGSCFTTAAVYNIIEIGNNSQSKVATLMCLTNTGLRGDKFTQGVNTQIVNATVLFPTDQFSLVVFTINKTSLTNWNFSLYVNSSLVASANMGLIGAGSGAVDTGLVIGRSDVTGGGSSYFNGAIDVPMIYNYSLSQSEVQELYNSGAGVEPVFSVAVGTNFSVIAKDYFTTASLTNFTATATNRTGYIYNGSTTNGTLNNWPILTNSTELWNISITSTQNGGYFITNYTNVNISSTLTGYVSQVYAYFNATELMINTELSGGTFSITGLGVTQTVTSNTLINLTATDFNVTYTRSGFYNKTQGFTYAALSAQRSRIVGVFNATANFTLRNNLTNALISSFTVNLSNSTYSFLNSNGTSASFLLNNITAARYDVSIFSSGYFPTSFSANYSYNATNNTYYLMPIGGLNVQFISTSTGAIINTTNSTIIFQNSTRSLNYTIINGQGNITGLAGDTYTVLCQTPGFSNNTYAYTYSDTTLPDVFTCFMTPGTTQVTIQVQTPDLVPLQGVLVSISQFVNGTLQVVSEEYTDATGQTVMNLLQGVTTTIDLSLDGYLSQSTTNSLDLSTYTFTLNPVNRFNPNNNAANDIIYQFYPTQIDLNLSEWNFELNVTPLNGVLLNYIQIEIHDQNDTYITRLNSTVTTGGRIVLPFNTTPYNNTYLRVYYSFQKENFTTYTAFIIYHVGETYYTGSITEGRDYAIANFTLGERIFLWLFLTIVSALLLSAFGIKDLANVLCTAVIWMGLGWFFGMNLVIVGFILFIIIIFIMRYSI